MTQTVTLPDGSIHNFPDEATPEMMSEALGLKSSIAGDVAKTVGSNIAKGLTDVAMVLPNTLNQAIAGPQYLAKGIYDTFKGNPTDRNFKPYQPFFSSEDVTKNSMVDYQPQTMAGNAVEMPIRLATNLLAPIGFQKAGEALPKIGDMLANNAFIADQSSGANINALQNEGVQKLLMPKQTAAEIADTASQRSSGGGFLNKQIYKPTDYEKDMVKYAREAGIKKGDLLVDANQKIIKYQQDISKEINDSLAQIEEPIKAEIISKKWSEALGNLNQNKLINAESSTTNGLIETAKQAINNNPKTPLGIWNARKQFDQTVLNFQPGALDQSANAKAFSYTAKQIRNAFNQMIIDGAPNKGYEEFLDKYTKLSTASENIAGKLSTEKLNRLSRFLATPAGKAVKATVKYGTLGAAAGEGYKLTGHHFEGE